MTTFAEPTRLPSIDASFLLRWSPARWILAGIIFYAAAIILSPLEYLFSVITWSGAIYAISVIFALFVGCFIGKVINSAGDPVVPRPFQVPLDRYINLTIGIASLSIAARIFDRFILRGFKVEETFDETRGSLAASVSLFGYLGGAGFTYGGIALALIWLSSNQRRRPVTLAIVGLLAAYPMGEALLQGSRSTMFHTAFLIFFYARSTGALRWLIRSRLTLVGLILATLAFFQIIFEIRSLEGGGYEDVVSEVYRLSAAAEYAMAPPWIINAISESDGRGIVAEALKVWTHFEQYLTHSWLVYFVNYESLQEGSLGWGRIHLNTPLRALGAMINADLTYDAFSHGQLEGIFSTAISPVYYDFGMLGPLFAGLFGLVATLVQAKAIRLPERWLPLYALLCFGCATILIDNQLLEGLGTFAIWGSILYAALHFVVSLASRRAASPEEAQVFAE
jgi:hypothetical protein